MRADSIVTADPPTRLLGIKEVRALTGVSIDTIYRWGREGKFPVRIEIGERCSRWREDEIRAWIEARSAERDGQYGPATTTSVSPQTAPAAAPPRRRGRPAEAERVARRATGGAR